MRWHAVEINAPESTLFADSLRTWYIYHERACQEIYNTNFLTWWLSVYGFL